MDQITVSAPGKIILMGEHSVVYGRPAIIAAVDRRCFVSISANSSGEVKVFSEQLEIEEALGFEKITDVTENARQKWLEFLQTGDPGTLISITERPLDYIAIIVGETFRVLKSDFARGFSISIDMEIPIGSGMGSSAALATSIAGGILVFAGETFDREKINEIAFSAEEKKHGLPSGGDNSSSCFGGLLWYRRGGNGKKLIEPLAYTISQRIADNFVVIDSGKPVESTGEMVGHVAKLKKNKPEAVEKIFNEQEQLTSAFSTALQSGDSKKIVSIMREGERNLERIDVVSKSTKTLIRKIEQCGGAAKVCGAGGLAKGSGILLAYHDDLRKLEDMLVSGKISFFKVMLGEEGVRVEA